ncbi:MAG: ribosome maturation factor RimM [Bacteroidaceae bacterium]|nr:ribosome maturation factor RimM [Bacteroidaceae bacterium]
MIRKEDTYPIGRITKAHGLRGEVVFDFEDDIFDRVECPYLICEVEGILVPFFIEEYRFKNDASALVKFEDIDSVEQAQKLLGSNVFFENIFIASRNEEEVSLNYFIGFVIADTDGKQIGTIIDVDDMTENWLFEVQTPSSVVLIPAHEDLITDINHKNKTIQMNLPTGLLNL